MGDVGHAVQPRITDDLVRNRLTIFFRLLLGIPHYIWLALWSIAAFFAAIANWVATLATGRPPSSLHRFLSAYVRYAARLNAYILLVANPYPSFTGSADDEYPFDVRLPEEPVVQPRWKTLLRVVLVIPAAFLSASLGGSLVGSGAAFSRGRRGARYGGGINPGGGFLAAVCAFLGWFASLVRGRMPQGLRDAGAYGIGYGAQTLAYLLLLTDRYPNADPEPMLRDVEAPPPHPVAVTVHDDLVRSRITVFFRLLLAIPHIVWLVLWTLAALVVGVVQWFATLFSGRPTASLHRFLSAYVRYSAHVNSFLYLVANPFPGFTGEERRYPVDVHLPPAEMQSRAVTFFRIFLAVPAWIVNSALSYALLASGILVWFVSLATGRAPVGLRNLGAYAIRYGAQTNAYLYLVTDRYPHASPLEGRESPPSEAESLAA